MKVKGIAAVLMAYPASALAAGFVVMIGFIVISAVATLNNGLGTDEIARGLWIAPVAWIYAALVYLVGLAVVGTPAWLMMSRQGRRSRRDATIVGAALSALAGLAILFLTGQLPTAWEPWALAGSLTIPGMVAGWVLHRVAYGRG